MPRPAANGSFNTSENRLDTRSALLLAVLLEFLRYARRKITEHAGGAGSLERDQAFHHRLLAVEPAVLCARHDHGIFARHLIREGRQAEGVLHAPQDRQSTRLNSSHVAMSYAVFWLK